MKITNNNNDVMHNNITNICNNNNNTNINKINNIKSY